MPLSFQKTVALLEQRKITSYTFKQSKVLSQSTITKLRRNQCVTTDTIETLCRVLNCQPGNLMEYVPDEAEASEQQAP